MKKIFIISALLICTGLSAQRADIRKAAERYKDANTVITNVTQIRHNTAIAQDMIAQGHFYYKKPNCQSMIFKDAKEMLLAVDNTFVMVKDGKQRTARAKGKGNNPFEVLQSVFRNLLSADDDTSLSELADVKLTKQGDICTITITPTVTDTKVKRRMMFTSCVATIDLKVAELHRLRINEQGGNYTQYDFSNYLFNAEVSDNVFDVNAVQ
ncbi:LolA family protein [Parabacteroides bouchesdurhonensis]|uniref:LolA family protein n=1 Tax=Parabacteroides bouchesdurhonensis TaxID=1936995 RepID=UPI000E4D3114|nr:outer membrane lipoprotein carrier protein LolA [Parabacteroides bouchesdurhonensis]RHJ93495.1 outer membrane lipoprotein carrier protein LolA [Bacteroides sp. AM07-16]